MAGRKRFTAGEAWLLPAAMPPMWCRPDPELDFLVCTLPSRAFTFASASGLCPPLERFAVGCSRGHKPKGERRVPRHPSLALQACVHR